jgi:RNA polymerase sigma factor (sigma-70 family)
MRLRAPFLFLRPHVRHAESVFPVRKGMVMKQPFEKVVKQHGGTVLRVCRVVLGVHDAEDAWSEAFLAALRAYPDLPDDANAEAWLVTIAHRKAIDVLRARTRQPAPVGDVPEAPTTLGVPGDDEKDGDLWHAVAALPEKQRQAVAYHYVAGLAYAEIAEILGGTTDAARRAAADGIKNLRKNYPGATTEGAPS